MSKQFNRLFLLIIVSLFCHPIYSGTGDQYYMDDINVTSNVQTITVSVPDNWQSYYDSHNGYGGFSWSIVSPNKAVYFVSSTSGTSCTITVKANLLNGNDKLYCSFGYWLGGVTPYFTELIWNIKKGNIIIPVEDIKLDNSSVSLLVGEEKQLTATVLPSNATNKSVTWSSDETSVATVSNGLIKAIGTGKAKITCEANDDSGVKAECYVDVAPSEFTSTTVEGVEVLYHILDKSDMTCAVGGYDSYGSSKNAIDENTEGAVTIPEKVNGYRVVEIMRAAFQYCKSVSAVKLPSSVTVIGNCAFQGCQSLSTVTGTENLEYIGYRSFFDTPWLKSFDDGPVYIGKVLYTYNGNLSEDITLDVKEGTTCISGGGLYMNQIVGINIPKSVKYVGSSKDNFYYSPFTYSGLQSNEGLSSITVASDNEVYDSRGGCNAVIEKSTNKLIAGCRTSIIPNDVITIGERSFDGIPIESIIIPDNVKTIEDEAFYHFYGRDIVIGASVESIPRNAFMDTSEKLRYIKVSFGNTHYDSRNNCNAIIETATNKLILGGPSTVIPTSVKVIGESAFHYCAPVLVIPDGVEKIEKSAFIYLNTLYLGNDIKEIQPYTFVYGNLVAVHASSSNPNEIDENAFSSNYYDNTTLFVPIGCKSKYQSTKGWSKFKNIIESNGHMDGDAFIAETIESYPIEYRIISEAANTCELIKPLYKDDIIGTVTIPEAADGYQVISIGSQAFQSCKSLETVAGGKNVETVGEYAFSGTSWYYNLPEGETYLGKVLMRYVDTPSSGILNIKDGTTCIYNIVYGYVNRLKYVRIPKSVKQINDYAFQYCSESVGIISMIEEPLEINAKVFNNSHFANATLYVPVGTKALYQATEGWNKFQNIVEGEPEVTIKGDVNGDGSVNGTDLVALTNIILGKSTETSAADVNGDGSVNGTDYVALVNIILGRSSARAVTRAAGATGLSIEPFDIKAGETKEMVIDLTNPDDEITLVQFDLSLPKGLSIKKVDGDYDIDLERTTWKKHSLDANAQADGTIRFLLASNSNTVLSGTSGAIIKVTLIADNSFDGGDIKLENILMVTPDEKERKQDTYVYSLGSDQPTPSSEGLSFEPFSIKAGETEELVIDLTNPDDEITLVQFDLRLPDGLSIKKVDGDYDIDIAGRTTWKKHSLDAYAQADGSIRFLLASNSNTVLSGTDGAIIKITLVADDSYTSGDIRLENILLVTPGEKEIKPDDVGIVGVMADADKAASVYSLSGQRLAAPRRGINIVGGKKVVVK